MKKIKLSKNKYALVDDDDFGKFSGFKWHLTNHSNRGFTEYIIRRVRLEDGRRKTIYLHREIMAAPTDKFVDHKNGDGFDNRKQNLRICSPAENNRNQSLKRNNTSGFKGVDWVELKKKWRARIGVGGKRIMIGYFNSKLEAIEKYCESSKIYHGEFSKTY